MVYVYSRISQLNRGIGRKVPIDQIKNAIIDMGMDIKGQSADADPELKIELTAEKIDLVSGVGIARAIKYYLGLETNVPQYSVKKTGLKLIVEKPAADVRPKIAAAIVRGMKINGEVLKEIIDVQEKIHDSFGRDRKKAAIGIYPLSKIKFPLKYTAEPPDKIMFRPLDHPEEISGSEILKVHETGKKYAHLLEGLKRYPVLRDANDEVLSMPPIINSEDVGKVEEGDSDLFIECTGHNLTHLDNVMKVLVTTLIELGAKAESVKVEYPGGESYELSLDNYEDEIDCEFVNKWIGIKLKPQEMVPLLNKMMYGVKSVKGNKIKLEIPCFRSDVWHDVDIADDVARAYGYNNIKPTFPQIASTASQLEFSLFRERVSESMVSLGFLELYTYMLASTETQYDKMCLKAKEDDYVRLPDSADMGTNMVRTMILPENLTALNINRKNKYPQKVFENGFIVSTNGKDGPVNDACLSVSIADGRANYTKIKGVLDALMSMNGISFEVRKSSHPFLIEGRQADVYVNGKNAGYIGELHPQVIENFGLLVPVACLEINLDTIWAMTSEK